MRKKNLAPELLGKKNLKPEPLGKKRQEPEPLKNYPAPQPACCSLWGKHNFGKTKPIVKSQSRKEPHVFGPLGPEPLEKKTGAGAA